MARKYYKVVRRRTCELASAVARGAWSVTYTPGQWTEPDMHGSMLFVFDSLDLAINFAAGNSYELEVWRCHVRGVAGPMMFVPRGSLWRDWAQYWSGLVIHTTPDRTVSSSMHLPSWAMSGAPDATVVVRKVKLVERVWWTH